MWSTPWSWPRGSRSRGPSAPACGPGSPEELVKQVGIDGWFFVIALVGGLVGGIVLMAWRRRDPLLMVVLVVLGGGLASWLMVRLGLALGPEKALSALGGMPDGAQVSMRLKLVASGMDLRRRDLPVDLAKAGRTRR